MTCDPRDNDDDEADDGKYGRIRDDAGEGGTMYYLEVGINKRRFKEKRNKPRFRPRRRPRKKKKDNGQEKRKKTRT